MEKDLVFSNIAGCTDVGLVRDNNEDAFLMADLILGRTLPDTFHVSHRLGENSILLVVSDGVGGSNGGEVASDLTVLAIKDALLRLPKTISPYDRLVAAVEEANHLVWSERQNSTALGNMSATVVAALIESNQVYIAEVGDSRAYLIRKNNIKQVTTDQSFVAQLVIRGILKPEQAIKHPRRNVILQSIGNKDAVKVAVSMFQLQRNDILILCTDGLSNLVRADEILQVSSSLSPENACWRMIQMAKERGGQDNITLILGRFYGDSLTSDVSVSRLTQAVKPLAVYDPDEVIEKSHKRTRYLGNAAIVSKLYGSSEFQHLPRLTPTDSLANFPNASIIKQEWKMLMEHLDYCYQILALKPEQVEQAAQWLESNGMQYTKRDAILKQLQENLEQLKTVTDTISQLRKEWDSQK
ncbi:MAG: hypothetical protein FD167_1514 [bacterium]|nr:MAG: hypothetical protein FD167_1514 [bacterium]